MKPESRNPPPERSQPTRAFRNAIAEGRFGIAFEEGERLLDGARPADILEQLMYPVGRDRLFHGNVRVLELLQLLERERTAGHGPWWHHLRFALLECSGWHERALEESSELDDLPGRYAWMRYGRGHLRLNVAHAYRAARRDYEATLGSWPGFWKATPRIAECLLCEGDETAAFAIMDGLVDRVREGGGVADGAATWRGEMHLWLGRYPEAIADLDPPAGRDDPLALGWRGATFLLLEEVERALSDLDRALELNPGDPEARVWRGEALSRQGRWEEALRDFDEAAFLTKEPFWPLVDRAIARAALGDESGLWSDFDRLPRRLVDCFEWSLGIGTDRGRSPEKALAVLRGMIEAARGIRRSEPYLYPLWLGAAARLRLVGDGPRPGLA